MEHRGPTFALLICTAWGALKARGDFRSQMCLHYCGINVKPYARGPIKSFITICDRMQNGHSWFRKHDFFLNNDQESQINSAHKQCSTLQPMLFPLVDLRSAYPFSLAPNSLELSKQDWLLVQPEQHVTQKPAHPQDTCISSNPICSFVHSPAHSSLFVSPSLSQLRPTIPSDLKRLNQCLCQTTSWQPLATADIIHLFLLTNLSIHSTGNETSPFAGKQTVCLRQHTGTKRTRKQSNILTLNARRGELRGDVKMAPAPWKGISGIKYWSWIHNVCKGVTNQGKACFDLTQFA